MKTARTKPVSDQYGDLFGAFIGEREGKDSVALLAQRRAAYDRFVVAGIPTRRVEAWKYTDVTALADRHLAHAVLAPIGPDDIAHAPLLHAEDETLVYVDGIMQPHLSHRHDEALLSATALSEALTESGPDLSALRADRETPFMALNHALWRDGLHLHLAANGKMERRIHVLFLHSQQSSDVIVNPRLLISLGHHAEASIAVTHASLGDAPCFNNATLDIALDEGAQLNFCHAQLLNPAATHIGATSITQQADTTLRCMDFNIGAALARHDLTVAMVGPGATTSLNGLYAVKDRQQVDCHTLIEHAAPNCSSRQLYKGILDDRATGVFNGAIRVYPGASATDGQQMNRNLLLSNTCKINAKPELQISNDDVKCTHGATVGRLDDQELFYLASRGIDTATARDMLSRGFAEEVLFQLADRQLHSDLHEILNLYFEKTV